MTEENCSDGHSWKYADADMTETDEGIEVVIPCSRCDAHCTGVCNWQD